MFKKGQRFETKCGLNMQKTGGPLIPKGSKGTILRVRRNKNKGYVRVQFDDFAPYDVLAENLFHESGEDQSDSDFKDATKCLPTEPFPTPEWYRNGTNAFANLKGKL
jgi:hypothetical protein